MTSPPLRFQDFELDPAQFELRRAGHRVRLERKPLELLILLAEKRGYLVSREEIIQRVWGDDVYFDAERGINNAIRKIRAALHDESGQPRFVETIVGKGYRFIAPLNREGRAATGAALTTSPVVGDTLSAAPASAAPLVTATVREPDQISWLSAARPRRFLAVLGLILSVLAIALTLSFDRLRHLFATSSPPRIQSLAVLPLTNLSGDAAQEYLADGMTEALIGRLSTIRGLRVISRTSVMRLKDSRMSAPQIAKELNVDAIVEGSVIRQGGRIRVHAQLIRAATDEHFWSETYDRELSDAMVLESDVAHAIAQKVEVSVSGKESERLAAAPRVIPEAYENYLKGAFKLTQANTPSETEESMRYFQDAIRLDPNFAPAYVGLASGHAALGTLIFGLEPENQRLEAAKAARKALELDPNLSDADDILAMIDQQEWHWAAAEQGFRRALQHNPNDASAHTGLAFWLLCQGRIEEALPWALRARELDRFGSSTYAVAWILFNARRYDEEIRELRSTMAVYPHDEQLLWDLGFALMLKGEPEQAIPPLEEAASLANRSPGTIDLLTAAYSRAGRRSDALRTLGELKGRQEKGYVPAASFVIAYIGLGDNEQAFAWLEKAFKEHSNLLQFAKVHPLFDPLRHDPRFTDLLRRIGLG